MTIFGMIGFDEVPKIQMGIVSDNPDVATTQFIDQLKEIIAFEVKVGALSDERAELEKGKRDLVLELPSALFPDPQSQVQPEKKTITVYKNISQEQQAETAISIISQILDKATLSMVQAPQLFELKTETVNAKEVRYIDFLLPGIVAMAVMQMAVFSVAFVFADYKEKGILKRLLATPLKPYQFVAANVVVRLTIAIIQTAILIAIGMILLKIHIFGSYAVILLVSILGGIMFLGLGFIISGIAKTVDSVPSLANLLVFPMLFLSGVFFPTESMPAWLQKVVEYLPLTHFADALRQVMADGVGLKDIANNLYWMLAWAVVLVGFAVYSFKFEGKRT